MSKTVSTQIRLPDGMHQYIQEEAQRMGVAQNAFLIILLEQGKRMWQAQVSIATTVHPHPEG